MDETVVIEASQYTCIGFASCFFLISVIFASAVFDISFFFASSAESAIFAICLHQSFRVELAGSAQLFALACAQRSSLACQAAE